MEVEEVINKVDPTSKLIVVDGVTVAIRGSWRVTFVNGTSTVVSSEKLLKMLRPGLRIIMYCRESKRWGYMAENIIVEGLLQAVKKQPRGLRAMTWVHKLRAVVSLFLLILGTIVLITGMLPEIAAHGRGAGEAAALGLARRAVIAEIHSYAGFIAAGLTIIHIYLNWKAILTALQTLGLKRTTSNRRK